MNADKITQYLTNPIEIQRDTLKELESRLDGGGMVVDGNNSFMFLLEAMSRLTSDSMNAVEEKLFYVYQKRASNMKELFQHVSDFGYVGFYSFPSGTKLSLTLHKQYIIDNSIAFPGSNYRVVIIPKDTTFSIGKYTFSLYYPIIIRVSEVVNNISIVYDTTNPNPLHSLNSNTLIKQEYQYHGVDFISFEFDVYQFSREVFTETITPEYGFKKRFPYKNKFYAIRIFSIDDNNVSTELGYTLSDSVYDPNKPTARLSVLTDESSVEVTIPQVYFTNNLVGNKLRIEIFNTLGELDVSIANIDIRDIKINFAFDSPNTDIKYSTVLKNIPTIIIEPTNTRITGGSNSLTFEEIKDIVVYHNQDLKVPITNLDINTFFKLKGFKPYKRIDNLTDRVYYGFRKVLDAEDNPIGISNLKLTVNPSSLDVNYSTVKTFPDDTFTILPTTIYRYIPIADRLEIMNDTDRTALLENSSIIDILNETSYLNHPYHITFNVGERYPTVVSYDLLNCNVFNIIFENENINLSAQANVVSVIIKHLSIGANSAPGSGGYKIRVGIQKTADLESVEEANIKIYLTFMTSSGVEVGLVGTFVENYNGLSVYDFGIETNYHLLDNNITITNLTTSNNINVDQLIPLSGTLKISAHVKAANFPGIADDYQISSHYLENDGTYIGMTLQSMSYSFGKNLYDVIDNSILVNWTGEEYQRYDTDIPLTYLSDVYERNLDGTLKITIVEGEVVLNRLHQAGDVITDGVVLIEAYRLVIGTTYKIVTRVTLDFTTCGAADNEVGTVFIASDDLILGVGDSIEAVIISHYAGDIIYSNPGEELKGKISTVIDNSGLTQEQIDNLKLSLQNMVDTSYIDSFGNRTVVGNRATDYTIDLFGVDYRHTYHNSAFILTLSQLIDAYYDSILEIDKNLLENTACFFRPITTMGSTSFRINNNSTAIVDLGLSFVLKCYVKQSVYLSNEIRDMLKIEIVKIIESYLSNSLISFTDICSIAKSKLSTYIVSLDIVSINDQFSLQTLMNVETEKEPRLNRLLVKNSDNTISFVDDVEIQFESLDT